MQSDRQTIASTLGHRLIVVVVGLRAMTVVQMLITRDHPDQQ